MTTTLLQPHQLLGAIYAGFVIGILYSFFGIFRFAFKKSKWCIYVVDSLFLASALIVIEITLLRLCDGEPWFYMSLGAAAGALLYGLTIHKLIKVSTYAICKSWKR